MQISSKHLDELKLEILFIEEEPEKIYKKMIEAIESSTLSTFLDMKMKSLSFFKLLEVVEEMAEKTPIFSMKKRMTTLDFFSNGLQLTLSKKGMVSDKQISITKKQLNDASDILNRALLTIIGAKSIDKISVEVSANYQIETKEKDLK